MVSPSRTFCRNTIFITCPCSAALSRQLIKSKFQSDFGAAGSVDVAEMEAWLGQEESIVATPHSQRSTAKVMVRLNSSLSTSRSAIW
ncbi:MAG: hypothetical protein Ct9H90mP27_4500 [Gammaproteobacteria bacterium]|nr:MAG: hypothetical protein Ct9H90mP27_4500 [Gammaproteobacteria bacterium]